MTGKGNRRVLLVRLGSMGDIVHALPALATLKENFPKWEVDWLVESRWRGLLDGNGCLNRVIECDTLSLRTSPFSTDAWRKVGSAISELRGRRYEWALDLQGALKSAIACRASGAAQVVGFDGAWLREPGASVFYNRRVHSDAVHAVAAGMALAASLGAARPLATFPLPAGDAGEVPPELLAAEVAVINTGAGWPAKQWTVAGYAALCDALEQEHGLTVVLNCGPGEIALAEQVRGACRSAQPRLFLGSLAGLLALLRRAALMIGPDTGPVHLAAAIGVPTLGLYGPTDPRRNGPYGERVRTLRAKQAQTSHNRSGAGDHSMQRIESAQVLEAVRELLAGGWTVPKAQEHCAAT